MLVSWHNVKFCIWTSGTHFLRLTYPGGNLREFTDEESNLAALLQRAMDLEGVDRETVHQLVTLLMRVSKGLSGINTPVR